MSELFEEQWELDGFLFGEETRFRLAPGLDFGSPEMAVQDATRPQGDGSLFGRDYLNGPELQFVIHARDGLDVWSRISEFQQVWRADSTRAQPGVLSVLRYRQNGRTYRYLGRGRKFDVVPLERKDDQWQQITATFKLAAPERYIEPADASTRTLRLDLIQADPDGGVVWSPDLAWPIEFRPTSQARVGEVTVGGFRPAPFKVQVFGPVEGVASKIRLSGDGWEIATTATVQHGQSFLIDTAANTFGRAGYSLAGTLSRTSRLTARLNPGHQFIQFDAVDPTNTAYAVVTWLDTVPA